MVEFAAHGTGKISTDRLMSLPLPIPPRPLQDRFQELAAAIRGQVTGLTAATKILRATRDLLLPGLVSGDINVEDLNIQLADTP